MYGKEPGGIVTKNLIFGCQGVWLVSFLRKPVKVIPSGVSVVDSEESKKYSNLIPRFDKNEIYFIIVGFSPSTEGQSTIDCILEGSVVPVQKCSRV